MDKIPCFIIWEYVTTFILLLRNIIYSINMDKSTYAIYKDQILDLMGEKDLYYKLKQKGDVPELVLSYDNVTKLSEIELNRRTSRSWHTRKHDDGWFISGYPDPYYFVKEFKARHSVLGMVEGEPEHYLKASSREAFDDFIKNHPLTINDTISI
jgi:hypothetical protein